MVMLYLLRHAKSAWDHPGLDDYDRPLAPRGEKAAATMAKYLAGRKGGPPRPDLILCSSAVRAQQTLERVLPIWPDKPPVVVERELYLCGASALLDRLRRLPEGVGSAMLVAHNPDLHELAVGLSGPGSAPALAQLKEKLPTGSFVVLQSEGRGWPQLGWAGARLTEFVTPRSLDAAGGETG